MATNTIDGQSKIEQRKQAYLEQTPVIELIEKPISYEQFLFKYLLPNKVCHFGAWATEGWGSREQWVTSEGRPHLKYLQATFGAARDCPVADCNTHEFDAHCKKSMSFSEYLSYFKDYSEQGHPEDQECLYLKDWHFVKVFPEYDAYNVPEYFQSDWLNEFLDEKGWEEGKDCDDYRFVYIGPKGSWTPFHSDVLRSHSWSANICGTKLWIFYPPGEEEKLRDRYGHLPFDINSADLTEGVKHPHGVREAKRLELVQRQGEVVFVPSGWHHQVVNLEDTISINHNWINGCSVDLTWQYLCRSLRETQREIQDCRDMQGWDQQCQLILKASVGVDFIGFYRFIHFIANKRLSSLTESDNNTTENIENVSINESSSCKDCKRESNEQSKYSSVAPGSPWHVVFDLYQVKDVLNQIMTNKDFVSLQETEAFKDIRPSHLLEEIDKVLSQQTDKCDIKR